MNEQDQGCLTNGRLECALRDGLQNTIAMGCAACAGFAQEESALYTHLFPKESPATSIGLLSLQ